MSTTKVESQSTVSNFDDERDLHLEPKMKTIGMVDTARVACTTLALAASITLVGLSADSLGTYNRTHIAADFFLPLWPANIDIRPTTALVATSTIAVVANLVSLLVQKMSSLRVGIHTSVNLAAPLVSFIVALISMSFYYGINASDSAETFQSWTCRWGDVPMQSEPHFGTLCHESQVATGLNIMLVPLELVILGLAASQIVLERSLDASITARERKASSPALS